MNVSKFDYVDDPTLAIFDDGNVAVAWVDQARHDVFLQIFKPDGRKHLAKPVNVSSSPTTFSWHPRLAAAPDRPQHMYALWQEIVFSGGSHGGEIFFARSADGGATFLEPVNLSRSVAGDGKGRLGDDRWDNGNLDIAVAPDGHIHAAWTEYEGRLWSSHSIDGGYTFAKPIHIDGNQNRPTRAPALEISRDGIIHLAWSARSEKDGEVHLAQSKDGGRTFGIPLQVGSAGYADVPQIAADPNGGLHLVYAESQSGPFGQFRIRYARLPANSRFSAPRTIAAHRSRLGSVHFPNLAVDEAGSVFVTWSIFPDYRHRARGWAVTVSRDGGMTFATPEVLPHDVNLDRGVNGGLQGSQGTRMGVGGRGVVAMTASTFGPQSSHIWLWRNSRPGKIQKTGS